MAAIPLPSLESLAHRAQLATLVSQLRPTQFRAPLTRLEAHRIPTLWTLYRGIMRDAPTETIRSHMRDFFRTRRSMRQQGEVTRELRKAHARWDGFRKAKEGSEYFRAVCLRYSRMIEGAALQARADRIYQEELAWYERMRTRPIVTGGYHKPSLFNGPLPRLRPQPLHITGMIVSRRKARDKRLRRHEQLLEDAKLLEAERGFENMLANKAKGASFERTYTDEYESWRAPIIEDTHRITESFERERLRANTPFPPEMLEQIKAARREKIANKTREREREQRGEITNRLLKRMRQSPPAHKFALMSKRQRRMDAIARGASEVGYVAKVKRALGHKLRDPDGWRVELGRPENKDMSDKMAAEIRQENAQRQAQPLIDNGDAVGSAK